ncbi:hypothetical protein IGI71_000705 [Enterococcus sp. DIV1279b]|uniref:DUF6075 family protein n=1 Tax=Enterococcus sp. DIV1279b TaxID=2774663 RepID=UPI003D2FCBE5
MVNFVQKEINSDLWFDGTLSGGEQRLVALAYNLFTNQDFYEFENGKRYNISPLEVFSGVDEAGQERNRHKAAVLLIQFHKRIVSTPGRA